MNAGGWQNQVNSMLGLWLIIAPTLLGYHGVLPSMRNSVFIGIVILIVSVEAIELPEAWEELICVLGGLWLISSPWILSFHGPTASTANTIIVGSLVVVFAMLALFRCRDFQRWWNTHHHPIKFAK